MLLKNKEELKSGKLTKWEYIDKMYESHRLLFEYSDFIRDTDISKVEISDGKVIMTFRRSGIKMLVNRNDSRITPIETFNFGSYEDDELQMQLKLIKPNDNVFDIGGNNGWFSLHIAQAFPNAKVYAFEPIPHTFAALSENVKMNKLNNIILNNVGLSDKEGSFDFYFDGASSGNASLRNVADKKGIDVIKCRVQTLDSFVDEKKVSVDYIKCDVEGAELFAFKGGVNAIKKHTPIIFTEMLRKWSAKFDYHPNDIIKLMSSLNYSCYELDKDKLKKIAEVTEETVATNFFFLHNEKHSKEVKSHS